jgi:hypothetical protein
MPKCGFEHQWADKEPIDYEFDNWYQRTYGNPLFRKQGRSNRYYELKKAWKASKEFYFNQSKGGK